MTLEREIRMSGVCMFCKHHTHDFPDDDWHEQRHMEGWHTCEIDGEFRRCKPFCKAFEMSGGVMMSGWAS